MPWNDTAQLNYLNPEVREAVIQTILNVARKFPVIRFDAAMTLAKKHYQRLWFPEPGTGGAIPSRAEHGLTKDQFDALLPKEFWREVVERVAQEVPDTLLLAEAFWMMEGYFVRTLGMHRVYNSAFMNMLKREENANYRSVMKNTLEFNPEILKRFVNFMNNPDEETAVAQFGKGDKYFGVCTLMMTLPGLPMCGHGQVEGLTEKYGMEYRRAYRDEQPDEQLVRRHEREIFPLQRRRRLFAEVEHFLLYDFFTPEGRVNEDVFAYSNRAGDERSLVVYHNKYASTRGWVRMSVGFAAKTGRGEERAMTQSNLAAGLGLHADGSFCIFRDHTAGLEYIRASQELVEKGLYLELNAYQCHVFLDFRQVRDDEWHHYSDLAAYLDGKGVPSIEEALRELFLQPLHRPFKELVSAGQFRQLLDARQAKPRALPDKKLMDGSEQRLLQLLRAVKQFTGAAGDESALARRIRQELEAVLRLPAVESWFPWLSSADYEAAAACVRSNLTDDPAVWGTLFSWVFVHALGRIADEANGARQSRTWIDEWLLGRILAGALQSLGLEEAQARQAVTAIKLLTTHQRWFAAEAPEKGRAYQVLEALLRDGDVQLFLQVNRYRDVLWYNKEAFDQLLWLLFLLPVIEAGTNPLWQTMEVIEGLLGHYAVIRELQRAGQVSEFQVEKLLAAVQG